MTTNQFIKSRRDCVRNQEPDTIKKLGEELVDRLHCPSFEEKQKPPTAEYKNENLSPTGKKIKRS